MKRVHRSVLLAALFSFILPMSSYAKDTYLMTIINHFDKPIHWTITINPQVLPDLPKEFTLGTNEQIGTQVLDLQKESYLAGQTDDGHRAFWGIEVVDNKLRFHGYIDKGIAYSWTSDTITFCTPDEYRKNGRHC